MSAVIRRPLWPSLLDEAINARRIAPFSWGRQDCCLFAADLIEAMTGHDLAKKFRGKYRTATGAAKVMQKAGGLEKTIEKVTTDHGLTEYSALASAQRGDLVLLENVSDGPALGVCIGNKAAAAGAKGAIFVPMSFATRAWRI